MSKGSEDKEGQKGVAGTPAIDQVHFLASTYLAAAFRPISGLSVSNASFSLHDNDACQQRRTAA